MVLKMNKSKILNTEDGLTSISKKNKAIMNLDDLEESDIDMDELDIEDDDDDEEGDVYGDDVDGRNLLSDHSEDDSIEDSIHSSDDDDLDTNATNKLLDNPAWADAMSKILKSNRPKNKKTIVLAKAKKLNDVQADVKKEKLGFEIVKNDNDESIENEEIKKEIDVKQEKADKIPSISVAQRRLLKKAWQAKGRVKPNVLDKDREKALSKIATRGVITLFNTVRQQQKTLEEKLHAAGSLETKREKALKSINKKEFMDTLAEKAKCETVDNPVKSESEEEDIDSDHNNQSAKSGSTVKTWNVLRNNFMMGASMKDWDKEEDGEEVKKPTKTKTKPASSSKFSFSMDVDADYDGEEDFGKDDESDDDGDSGESDGSDGGDNDDDGGDESSDLGD